MSPLLDIRNTTRGNTPRVPFERIARAIFPKDYTLSLVICADTLAQRMNRLYRKKSYSPNVLSFPLQKNEGEIFLNIRKGAREARKMGMSTEKRLAHLFIHACFHLKGYDHSDKMDALENQVLRKFGY